MAERSSHSADVGNRIRAVVITASDTDDVRQLLAPLGNDVRILHITSDGQLQFSPTDQISHVPGTAIVIPMLNARLKVETVAERSGPILTDRPAWVVPEILVTSPLERDDAVSTTRHRLPAVEGEGYTIGRSRNGCQLVLSDPHVSSHHLRFTRERGATMLTDLGSKWGTKVNGEILAAQRPRALQHNDVIQLGRTTIRFEHPWSNIRPVSANTVTGADSMELPPAEPAPSRSDLPPQPEPSPPKDTPDLSLPAELKGLLDSSSMPRSQADSILSTPEQDRTIWLVVIVGLLLLAMIGVFLYLGGFLGPGSPNTSPLGSPATSQSRS